MNNEKITSVILSSVDRPDQGSVNFSLYQEGAYILERMDGWSAISSINTEVEPYQLRNGSSVSNPNSIGGKILTFTVHIVGTTETQTMQTINRINGILQNQMKLNVIDNDDEFYLDKLSLMQGSYDLNRVSPTYYTLQFGLAAESAYKINALVIEKVISGGGDVIEGGIIYPTFTPYDDVVSYPDYTNAYNTITSIQQGVIVIEGNGDIYPFLTIAGRFWSVTITYTSPTGEEKEIILNAQGGVGELHDHIWTVDTESLEIGFLTPDPGTVPNWNDLPYIEKAEWFRLNVGQNNIKATFVGAGTVTAKYNERIF